MITVLFQTGPDLVPAYLSPNFEALTGFTAAEARGVEFWAAHVYAEDRPRYLAALQEAMRLKSVQKEDQYRFQRKDGSLVWLHSTFYFSWDEAGRLLGTHGLLQDMTAGRATAEALRRREEHLRLMIDSIQDYAIIMLDSTGHVVEWNPGAEQIKGYRAEDVSGRHFSIFYTPEDQATNLPNRLLEAAARHGRAVDEGWRVRRDGSRFWANVVISAVRDDTGDLLGFVKVMRDMTERNQAEEERLARAAAEQANRAKSEFLSRMSHELRTPLNAILGFAQILQMDQLSAEQTEAVGFIVSSGRHLLTLINEVLDISRIESGRLSISLEPVQLGAMLAECLEMIQPLAAQRQIQIAPLSPGTLELHVLADRQRLAQTLLNLLSNAIKYNSDAGSVVVATRPAEQNGWLRISVRDTGPGIEAAKMERLFTPFDRLDAERLGIEGTGLGLSLSRALVEAMGGAMGVASVVGEGSEFWIELPITAAIEKEPRMPSALERPPGERLARLRALLYIEDNPSNLKLIEHIVSHLPQVRLMAALSGGLGIELARAQHPDLILLDLNLPDLHGAEVLRRLKADARTRDIPVIVTSADASPRQFEALLSGGAHAYLTKPVEVRQLLDTLDKALGSAPPR